MLKWPSLSGLTVQMNLLFQWMGTGGHGQLGLQVLVVLLAAEGQE